jgi:polar amino acid transport system permease protein
MVFDTSVFWHLLFSTELLAPAFTTLWISVAAMAIGVALGFLGGLARISSHRPVRWFVTAYLWVFRGTPVLVQIVFWYDATAELTHNLVNLSAIAAGVIALGFNEGAYMTEIVRAGLLSVDPGQAEAAQALGLTYPKLMRLVVLPQAIRIIIPPTGNQYLAMLKTTSLLFAISVPELFMAGTDLYSANFRYFEVLSVLSIWYLFLSTVFSILQRQLERRFGEDRTNLGQAKQGPLGRLLLPGGAPQ